jgi:hypothetical protein
MPPEEVSWVHLGLASRSTPAVVILSPSFADLPWYFSHPATYTPPVPSRPQVQRKKVVELAFAILYRLSRGWFSGESRQATPDPHTDRHRWWRRWIG